MSEEIKTEVSASLFDKERFVKNVQKLAKDRGFMLSEVENDGGVSKGYLSRINKDGAKVMPSIDMIAKMANKLGTTIDALLFVDLTASTAADDYMEAFLKKLVAQTQASDMVWNVDTEEAVANICSLDPENVLHPLFRSFADFDERDITVYDSQFHPYESNRIVKAMPPFYHIPINDGKNELYLTRIHYKKDADTEGDEYELYMIENKTPYDHLSRGQVSTVCHSMVGVQNAVGIQLKYLYSIAGETTKHVKIEKPVRNAIDAFMADKEDN